MTIGGGAQRRGGGQGHGHFTSRKNPSTPSRAELKAAFSERSPLLPYSTRKREPEDEVDAEVSDGYSGAGFASGVFSVSTTIVGAGIMGLPATMKTLGLVPGILLIVCAGMMTNFSVRLLLKFTDALDSHSYAGVMARCFGRPGRILLQCCIIVNNFGLLLVYLIIIGDVLSGSTSSGIHHTGVLEEWGRGSVWWNGRTIVMFSTTIFILLPLASFRHIDSLRLSSALSVALAVVFVIVTGGITIAKLINGSIAMPRLFPQIYESNVTSILNLFAVIPVLVTAYICHHCVHPILNELEKPSLGQDVIRVSLIICTSIYVATSIFGYLLFGDQIMVDVLSNFDANLGIPFGKALSDVVRVGYAVHLMLVFPLLHFSLRLNLDGLIFPGYPPLSTDPRRFSLLTGLLIASVFFGATLVPSIWDAFQFTGATSAVCLGFIFPGIIVLRDPIQIATMKEKLLAWIMVVLAICASLIAITSDIYSSIDSPTT